MISLFFNARQKDIKMAVANDHPVSLKVLTARLFCFLTFLHKPQVLPHHAPRFYLTFALRASLSETG